MTILPDTPSLTRSPPDWLASGPFGLRMGMSAPALETDLWPIKPFWFRPTRVPRPHPDFPVLGLAIAPRLGLAWFQAVGRALALGDDQAALQDAFAAVQTDLVAVYGTPAQTDDWPDLRPATTSSAWVRVLGHPLHDVAATWTRSSNPALATHHLTRLVLSAAVNPFGRATGHFNLHGLFANQALAETEIAAWRIRDDD